MCSWSGRFSQMGFAAACCFWLLVFMAIDRIDQRPIWVSPPLFQVSILGVGLGRSFSFGGSRSRTPTAIPDHQTPFLIVDNREHVVTLLSSASKDGRAQATACPKGSANVFLMWISVGPVQRLA